jgi:hypothetical protein
LTIKPGAPLWGQNGSDLVAVVAPFSIKELRLVTVQLPEKSWPIRPVRCRRTRRRELRLIRLLRSSQRPMSRRRAHRFLKLDNLSAGVAAACAPGLAPVPAPSAHTLTIGELGLGVVHQSAQSPAFLGFGAARLWYPFVVHGSNTPERAKTARLRGVVALLAG